MPMAANNRVNPRNTMRINVRVAGALVAEKPARVNFFFDVAVGETGVHVPGPQCFDQGSWLVLTEFP